MQILLTGAAGFIGSHLSEKLLQLGHTITAVDNFDNFYSREIKLSNIRKCKESKNFNLIEGDISDIASLVPKEYAPDLLIHLAAKAGVRPSIENPSQYIQTNIVGTHNLLDWLKNAGCKKMIFASSSSVYGNNKKVPFSEKDSVDSPISPYAFTKKSCELLNYTYHDLYGINIINLRFFTVYGPRQRPDLAIHKFFSLINDNKPIEIYGDGTSGRDYTFIDDIVNGICSSMDRITSETNLFEIINLGNSNPVLLKDLINAIEEVSGKKAVKKFLPMQDGDVDLTFADISAARQKLNFNPSTSLIDGLKKFKSWYENG